jgi:hypothetical protein
MRLLAQMATLCPTYSATVVSRLAAATGAAMTTAGTLRFGRSAKGKPLAKKRFAKPRLFQGH